MDLETENRLAAMLMREAAELRRQAEQEGVLAYLRKPNVRSRPNSRFLTATVRAVQQANRSVEVNEMWRLRQKEIELDNRVKGTSTGKSSGDRSHRGDSSSRSSGRHTAIDDSSRASASCSSRRDYEHTPEGLKDEELEEFLHSRTKRGRGAVGPRMDETGPYLPPHPDGDPSTSSDVRERRVIFGPERPSSLKSYESSEEETDEERRKKAKKSHSSKSDKESYESSEEETDEERRKKATKSHSSKSDKDNHKEHSKKRRSKEKSKHKKKKEKREKRSKHHH